MCRTKVWLCLLALLCSALKLHALTWVLFEAVTATATATGFSTTTITPSGLPQAQGCTGRLETAEVRFRYDGTAPTSTVGTLLEVGDTITLTGHDVLVNFKAIRTGGTSGVIDFHCWAP